MKTRELIAGDLCRHCGEKIVLVESLFNTKKLFKSYFYLAYYKCPECGTMYLTDKFKIINDERGLTYFYGEQFIST